MLNPGKFARVMPRISDFHLLMHVLDLIFRKWAGFCLLRLAALRCAWTEICVRRNPHEALRSHGSDGGVGNGLYEGADG